MRAVCAPKCLEKDAHADFPCLHCYPNAVGDNTWAYLNFLNFGNPQRENWCEESFFFKQVVSSLITFYSVAAAQGGAGGFPLFV